MLRNPLLPARQEETSPNPALLTSATDFNPDLLNSYSLNAARKNLGSSTKLTLSPETEQEKEGV